MIRTNFGEIMSAINKHSIAIRVLTIPKMNDDLLSFMEIDDLARLASVSKLIPRKTITEVVRKRVHADLAKHDFGLWISIGGKNALKGVTIRNFPTLVQPPLSNYPVRCMAGFERNADGAFSVYQMERVQHVAHPRLPCLPDWIQSQDAILSGPNNRGMFEDEGGCCPPYGKGPGCLEAIRVISLSLFQCCCIKTHSRTGWITTFQENGGKFQTEAASCDQKEEAEFDDANKKLV